MAASVRSGRRGDDGGVGAVWLEGQRWRWRRYRISDVRLGWSPGGGGAAGSDRSGGEDEATEKNAWRLLDPVEEGGGDKEEEN